MKTSSSPVLSVITVVFNNVADIERTVRSVVGQSYPHIEYIVVDGASNDGTVAVLQPYVERGEISTFISEPDEGIYDAMNKGLARATGDYVLFMNSGDEIYDLDTVAKIFQTAENADIYYGETMLYDERWEPLGLRRHRTPEEFNWKSFRYGMNISHQAIYVRRSIAPQYDRQYRLSADVDWVIRAAKAANSIVNTRLVVAKYLVGGMSKQRHRASLKERFLILSKHYGFLANMINHAVIALRYFRYRIRNGKPRD